MHKVFMVVTLTLVGCGGVPSTGTSPQSTPPQASREWWCGDPSLQRTHISSPIGTSLALNGSGFFVLKTPKGLRFTRWGQFAPNVDGVLVNPHGLVVQGMTRDSQRVDLSVGPPRVQALATSHIVVKARLDPNASIVTFEPASPHVTSNFNASITIFDSLGTLYDLTIFFNRTGSGAWDWHAIVPDGASVGATAAAPAEIAVGTLTFTTKGALDTVTQTSNFTPLNAAEQTLFFNFGTALTSYPTGTGLDGTVQDTARNRFETFFTGQDGRAAGDLEREFVDPFGHVQSEYSNGAIRQLDQLILANFANPLGLRLVGEHLFAETTESGPPVFGTPMDETFGSVRSHALELPCDP